jgi:hypothetical protein
MFAESSELTILLNHKSIMLSYTRFSHINFEKMAEDCKIKSVNFYTLVFEIDLSLDVF